MKRRMLVGLLVLVLSAVHVRIVPPATAGAGTLWVAATPAATQADPANADFEELAHVGGEGEYGKAVAASGNTVYLLLGDRIALLDASDPAEPVEVGSIAIIDTYYFREMHAIGNRLYVAEQSGLSIFDVSSPAAPRLLGSYASQHFVNDVVISGDRAYLSNDIYPGGILILDVSNPASPTLLRQFMLPCTAGDMDIAGATLYVTGSCGLQIIDVSAPQNPVILGNHPGYHFELVAGDGVVYTTHSYAYRYWSYNFFQTVDVSDPASPTLLHELPGYGYSIGLWMLGQHVFNATHTLDINDVSDPAAPVTVKKVELQPRDLALSGTTAYVLDHAGLTIFDVSAPAAPVKIGGYTLLWSVDGSAVSGTNLYTFAYAGVQLVDIANPRQPKIKGQYRSQDIEDIAAVGSLVYAAGRDFRIIDFSDPLSPTLLSVITDTFSVDIELVGDTVYLGNKRCVNEHPDGSGCINNRGSHWRVDVGDPAAPQVVERFEYPADSYGSSHVYALEVAGDWIYSAMLDEFGAYNQSAGALTVTPATPYALDFKVADELMVAVSYLTMTVYDRSDPQAPAPLGDIRIPFQPTDVEIDGALAYVTSDPFSGMDPGLLTVISLADPTNPQLLASYEASWQAVDVELAGDLVVVAEGGGGLAILRYHGPVETTMTLTPAGGSLSSPDGALTFTFPAGAVAEPVALSLLQFRRSPHPLGLRERAAQTFRLTAADPDGALAALEQPYALTLAYTPGQLAAQGIPEASLELAAWADGAWRAVPPCAGCTLNQQTHRLTAASPDLGTFALIGRPFQAVMPLVQR